MTTDGHLPLDNNVAYVICQVKLFHLLLRSRHKSGGSCCYDDDGADEKKKIESVCSDSQAYGLFCLASKW
jgi:hypothetical protein